MEEVVTKTRDEKINLMRQVFNTLTGKKLQIIEEDEKAGNGNDVVLRNVDGIGIGRL